MQGGGEGCCELLGNSHMHDTRSNFINQHKYATVTPFISNKLVVGIWRSQSPHYTGHLFHF